MVTLAALILGLLIASAKVSFDRLNDEFTQTAATVIMIDRTLAEHGPEAKEARELLCNTYSSATAPDPRKYRRIRDQYVQRALLGRARAPLCP
ncbi:hypothetical protein [Paraburkholderia hospita]|uniref:hypothetical protein n=1 Tax=Paraburkholderia hospita TaxID=169430 RepID=UPI000B344E3C|nr:hypothetical protein [Paraburkholderia hospita]